jgi:uncharacterized protein YodC (DUF2158 family)
MADIKPGDTVQLKSGGPQMTVRWVEGGEAHCDWFVGAEARGHTFKLEQLETV